MGFSVPEFALRGCLVGQILGFAGSGRFLGAFLATFFVLAEVIKGVSGPEVVLGDLKFSVWGCRINWTKMTRLCQDPKKFSTNQGAGPDPPS